MSTDAGPADPGGGAVLRRIHKCYFKAGLEIPVSPEAFRPTDKDTDGLSVVLESAETAPEQALLGVDPAKHNLYYIARIPLQALQEMGLSVRPAPIDGAPGHAIIPQLNTQSYHNNKVAGKEMQKRLAELASANIIRQPPQA